MTTFDEQMQENAEADAGLKAAFAAHAARTGVVVPAPSVISRIADRSRKLAGRRGANAPQVA
jgi:hypothetical protein